MSNLALHRLHISDIGVKLHAGLVHDRQRRSQGPHPQLALFAACGKQDCIWINLGIIHIICLSPKLEVPETIALHSALGTGLKLGYNLTQKILDKCGKDLIACMRRVQKPSFCESQLLHYPSPIISGTP